MTNLRNVLNYKCRTLGNCGTNSVVGNFFFLCVCFFAGGLPTGRLYGGHMHGVPGRGLSIGFYSMLHMILGIACVGVGSFVWLH